MIHEAYQQQGSYTIPLVAETPPNTFATCVEFGVIYVTPQWVDPTLFADADIQAMARYAGPVLNTQRTLSGYLIEGAGMVWYLGGAEGDGPSDLEAAVTFSSATPTTVLAAASRLEKWATLAGPRFGSNRLSSGGEQFAQQHG